MDRKYPFGDINVFDYFSDINKQGKYKLVMSMNRGMIFSLVMIMDKKYCFGDVNEFVCFGNVNKQGK